MGYFYILMTLLFTVYGQLVIKWQIDKTSGLPDAFSDKVTFLFHQLLNPWILSGFASAFFAALFWMAAMTMFDLNKAYPFMSLAFVLVLIFTAISLKEPVTWPRAVGTAMIVLGLIVLTR